MPADLDRVARRCSRGRAPAAARPGSATTAHPFGPGEPLRLGGIEIAGAPRLHGHSDGDVALHAIADALLGAAGLGRPRAAVPGRAVDARGDRQRASSCATSSRASPATAGDRSRVDLTIVGARPRLGAHLEAMRGGDRGPARASTSAAVSVKASTGNLDGRRGRRAGRSRPSRSRRSDAPGRSMTLRLQDTLTGETRPLVPLERRPRPDLLVRPDGLRPGAHRQLPVVPVRRPARALPALARPTRAAGS